jgi:multiple sugar transport system ATP-binding protein
MAKIIVENLNKKYGKITAVDHVSLDVAHGEFVCLLGPSGCGKTTTLRMIAGLERQDSGNIYIGDVLVNDVQPKDRDIAMVFQSYALYPSMNVYDNIAYPLKIRRTPSDEIRRRVMATVDLLGLGENLLHRRIANLSGGEKQRVAIGRAIIREPEAYLMDEPLSNLDAKMRVYMRAEIKKLQTKLHATMVYVTHDQVEAMSMADRIAVMNSGKVLQYDLSENLYNHPVDRFVAGFMGSPGMNFVECTCVERGQTLFLDGTEFSLDITMMKELVESRIGSRIILGIRPEHVTMSRTPNGKDSIEAVIEVVERVNPLEILSVRIGKDVYLKVISALAYYATGERVWLNVDRDRIHLMDPTTGKAIA